MLYVSSNPKDYQKEYTASWMYRYVDLPVNWILLNITIPPGPEATPTTTNVPGGIIMKIIPKENKGKERSNNFVLYCNFVLTKKINVYRALF